MTVELAQQLIMSFRTILANFGAERFTKKVLNKQ